MELGALERLPAEEAEDLFLSCCGSRRWAREMAARRPFGSHDALTAAAEEVWWSLGAEDWRQALAAHPRIGERPAGEGRAAGWSAAEQAGMGSADEELRAALARGNRDYEERFGLPFVVRASGRSGDEMLAILRRRLGNDSATELRVAAGEQAEITRLRLEKLLAAG